MRKIIFLLLVFGALFLFQITKPPPPAGEIPIPPTTSPLLTPTPVKSDQIIDFEKDGLVYRAVWAETADFKNLFLYPNFKEKLTAQEIFSQKRCKSLVSGGFYSKENEPIGLFISGGEKLKGWVANRLFDGIFSVDENGKADITWEPPQENLRLALQSGPVLIKDGKTLKLQIKDDKSARRVVLALNRAGEVTFLIIFNRDSVLEGPRLADLPEVAQDIGERTGFEFTEAINLDGGSASAFYSDFLSLPEFSAIGSYFCFN